LIARQRRRAFFKAGGLTGGDELLRVGRGANWTLEFYPLRERLVENAV
jgi:hypothetical protein